MKPVVRIATPRDAHLIREVYAYYIEHTEATFNEVLKPLRAYAADIRTLVKTYPYLIAEDWEGRFLGFANAEPVRPQSGYRYSVELTIYLHPQAPARAGIGTALYNMLLRMLKAQGFVNAYGVVNSSNQESLALHAHYGFTVAGELNGSGYKHGKWLSAVWLHKQLNDPLTPPPPIVPFEQYRKTLPIDQKGNLR